MRRWFQLPVEQLPVAASPDVAGRRSIWLKGCSTSCYSDMPSYTEKAVSTKMQQMGWFLGGRNVAVNVTAAIVAPGMRVNNHCYNPVVYGIIQINYFRREEIMFTSAAQKC